MRTNLAFRLAAFSLPIYPPKFAVVFSSNSNVAEHFGMLVCWYPYNDKGKLPFFQPVLFALTRNRTGPYLADARAVLTTRIAFAHVSKVEKCHGHGSPPKYRIKTCRRRFAGPFHR